MSKLKLFLKKSILASIVAIGIFGWNQVFAWIWDAWNVDWWATASTACRTYWDTSEACKRAREEKLIERASLLDDILRAMYLLIWPIIMISWLAIDNKLVFGESIWLDLYLRKFWTIMMVIAYMWLWVSLLITVYEWLKEWWDNLIKKLKETWKKAALAAILIPLSWFLVQQLVNLSTLMTFSVWALPLYVNATSEPDCWSAAWKNNALCWSLLQTHTRFNLTDAFWWDRKSLALYSTRDPSTDEINAIYLQCPIVQSEINFEQHDQMMKWIQWTDEKYASLKEIAKTMIMEKWKTLSPERVKAALEAWKSYCVIKSNTLYKLDWKNIKLFSDDYKKWIVDASDVLRWESNTKIHSILELNKSAIWPLYAIYWSILDFWSISSSLANNPYPAAALIEAILKAFQWFMLFIPLVWFAIVMIVRIWYLWVIIWFSPLIVLVNTVFKDGDAAKKVKDIKYFGSLWETLNWVQIAKLIMQPTIVMFALSIWLIFLAIIHQSLNLNKEAMDYYTFGIQMETNATNQSCFDILNLQTVCLDWPGLWYWLGILSDLFNWWILNIIWIMVVWWLFFMALKSNKITESVAQNIETIAENYVWTREIIPIWDKKVWFMAAKKWIDDTIEAITKVDWSKQYDNVFKPLIERWADRMDWKWGEMNSWIQEKLKEKTTIDWVEKAVWDTDDTKVIADALSWLSGNYKNFTINDIDSKWFKWQDIWWALTQTEKWFYHAWKESTSYKDVIAMLDSKKFTQSDDDKKKYIENIHKTTASMPNKYFIWDWIDFVAITKDRAWNDAMIEVTHDNKWVIKDIKWLGWDIFSWYKNSKNIDDMEKYLNTTFNWTWNMSQNTALSLLNKISWTNNSIQSPLVIQLDWKEDKNNPNAPRTKEDYKIEINNKGKAVINKNS